jgi:cyclic-di-AMP phosphodiesterase PgpH
MLNEDKKKKSNGRSKQRRRARRGDRPRRRIPRRMLVQGLLLVLVSALLAAVMGAGPVPERLLPAVQLAAFRFVALLVLLACSVTYAQRHESAVFRRGRRQAAFVMLLFGVVAIARYCAFQDVTPLIVPVPLAVMVMCLVGSARAGLGTALLFSLVVRLTCPGADVEFYVLLVGGMTAALVSQQVRTRSSLIIVGLLTGGAMLCMALTLKLIGADGTITALDGDVLRSGVWATVNGALGGFLVSGLLPAIEHVFDVTTDVRLLEWSDPNKPLLRKLLLEAPGTYHHSMVVGNLSADAAANIGANARLARVAAYFHDVGKLRKPEYFGENQTEGMPNPHDSLSPSMSSLIITAHPKDGADMADQYRVPSIVRDIIVQSHGSSVVSYFWKKASEGADANTKVNRSDFRYRLPKPASKEAAVVMICDAVESATRSLASPTLAQLRNMTREIIMDRLHDGQLDESGLSITDLKRIEDTLVHGLTAVFHNRVRYPGQDEIEKDDTAVMSDE